MQFYDSVQISIHSGKGGDGCASARREKYMEFGGPNGGNGGRGGSVVFIATHNEMTLLPYREVKIYKADHGMPGQTKEMYGQGAEDLVLKVPCGTLIKDTETGDIIAHLEDDGDIYTALKGGKGGVGNMHFKSSRKQFADFALLGEPGQMKAITLELMLLADVALVGTPSVGKSSLINVISDVKAKTAEYPFTTLVPNLGIIRHKQTSFSMIDVPGLIEGASEGKGLGNNFLRHILKSRIFVLCMDSARFDSGLEEFPLLFNEILQYIDERHEHSITHDITFEKGIFHRYMRKDELKTELLYKKHLLPILTKIDHFEDIQMREMLVGEYAKIICATLKPFGCKAKEKEVMQTIMSVSIVMPETTEIFLDRVISYLDDASTHAIIRPDQQVTMSVRKDRRQPEIEDITEREIDELIDGGYLQATDKDFIKIWSINHPEIAYLTFVLPRGNDEAELRYRQTLSKEHYLKSYEKAGARKGDVFKVITRYMGQEDKYILWD